MQILITHGSMARSRVVHFGVWQLAGLAALLTVGLMLFSGAIYHFVFLTAARDGWPLVSQVVRFVVRDEIAQRERFMRDNLDAMARRVGEMQARLVELEAMGDRVSGLAGVAPDELKPLQRPAAGSGRGGPFVPLDRPSLDQLRQAIDGLEIVAEQRTDVFLLAESRLFEQRLARLLVPSTVPVDGPVGSGFGFRADPFTGRAALHTGLDFPADTGTPIAAAAGGVVSSTDVHPQYGRMLEIDHGNGLVTRYAHASRVGVKVGDLVRKGQAVAEVGSSGRSTGPHLHFEVLVDGVPQDPARFLSLGPPVGPTVAHRPVVPAGR